MEVRVVLPPSTLSIPISQNPQFLSCVENTVALPGETIYSSIRVIGYESRLATTFNVRLSTQHQRILYFLGVNTTVEAYFVCTGSIEFFQHLVYPGLLKFASL